MLEIRFPKGKNPWKDLYDEDTTIDIGKILELKGDAKHFKLRRLLCVASEQISAWRQGFGGVSSKTETKAWLQTAISKAKALSTHLVNAEHYAPEPYLPGAYSLAQLDALRRQIDKLHQNFLLTINGNIKISRNTIHADYLQITVDRFTEVFLYFRPISELVRNSGDTVYGRYPDFVRQAAKPYLAANYIKYRRDPKRYEKLDRQIQESQRLYSVLYDRSRAKQNSSQK